MRNINAAMEYSYFSPPQYSFPPLESKLIRVHALKYIKLQLIYIFSVCSLTSMHAKVKINHLKIKVQVHSPYYIYLPLCKGGFLQPWAQFQARFSHLRTCNSRSQNTVEPLLRDTVMITQKVTISNAQECKIQKWNKILILD